jgi:hypothetical protein
VEYILTVREPPPAARRPPPRRAVAARPLWAGAVTAGGIGRGAVHAQANSTDVVRVTTVVVIVCSCRERCELSCKSCLNELRHPRISSTCISAISSPPTAVRAVLRDTRISRARGLSEWSRSTLLVVSSACSSTSALVCSRSRRPPARSLAAGARRATPTSGASARRTTCPHALQSARPGTLASLRTARAAGLACSACILAADYIGATGTCQAKSNAGETCGAGTAGCVDTTTFCDDKNGAVY